jgi:hypothetical protein
LPHRRSLAHFRTWAARAAALDESAHRSQGCHPRLAQWSSRLSELTWTVPPASPSRGREHKRLSRCQGDSERASVPWGTNSSALGPTVPRPLPIASAWLHEITTSARGRRRVTRLSCGTGLSADSPAALGQQDRWTARCSAAWWTPPSETTAPSEVILPARSLALPPTTSPQGASARRYPPAGGYGPELLARQSCSCTGPAAGINRWCPAPACSTHANAPGLRLVRGHAGV